MFLKDEKVFSLAKTAAAVPFGDITKLFEELYCYLLVAGLFREGEATKGVYASMVRISSNDFRLPAGSYREGLAEFLRKGLTDRFKALIRHRDLSENEKKVLVSLDTIFMSDTSWYAHLTGRDLLSIAYTRAFSDDMKAVARYVAVSFGQYGYPEPRKVPILYLSVFGNIHLSKVETTILGDPVYPYGSRSEDGSMVTALWSMLSAQIESLTIAGHGTYPGDALGEYLSSLSFLGERAEYNQSLSVPRYATALALKQRMGMNDYNPVSLSASFYNDFLYGTIEALTVTRQALLIGIVNLMMEKMGETHLGHLFMSNSCYRKLVQNTSISSKTPKRPVVLQFALEALDPELLADDAAMEDDLESDDDTTRDPQVDDGAFDPSAPPPGGLSGLPSDPLTADSHAFLEDAGDMDTIDLISFDKSGEGVNEDLYRSAVVALNDRLQSDNSLPISAEAKESLSYWVNGFLYRTAISATKDQITFLKLQTYLKPVSTKG